MADRKPFQLDVETHSRLKMYSDITGVPMSKVVREAIADWLETVGATRIESFTHKPVSAAKAEFYRTVAEHGSKSAFDVAAQDYQEAVDSFKDNSDRILDNVVPLKPIN